MLTLVKTMKTMCLSDRVDWAIVNKTLLGVHFMNEVSPVMVFKIPGYGETRLMSTNHSHAVAFMTLHEPKMESITNGEDVEGGIMERILKSSGVLQKGIGVTKTLYNYFVFNLEHEREINNVVLEYRMRSRGIKTIMDFEIHGALVVQIDGTVWHFFNSGKVFAFVGGYDLKNSMRITDESWSEIKKYV